MNRHNCITWRDALLHIISSRYSSQFGGRITHSVACPPLHYYSRGYFVLLLPPRYQPDTAARVYTHITRYLPTAIHRCTSPAYNTPLRFAVRPDTAVDRGHDDVCARITSRGTPARIEGAIATRSDERGLFSHRRPYRNSTVPVRVTRYSGGRIAPGQPRPATWNE